MVLAVNGLAFTVSIELALASDFVIAADDVRCRQLEIGIGRDDGQAAAAAELQSIFPSIRSSEDAAEGIASFIERRTGTSTGDSAGRRP